MANRRASKPPVNPLSMHFFTLKTPHCMPSIYDSLFIPTVNVYRLYRCLWFLLCYRVFRRSLLNVPIHVPNEVPFWELAHIRPVAASIPCSVQVLWLERWMDSEVRNGRLRDNDVLRVAGGVGWYDWIWYDWCVWVWYQRYISKMWLIFTKRNVIPWFPGSSIG